jgi:hypothetical protein
MHLLSKRTTREGLCGWWVHGDGVVAIVDEAEVTRALPHISLLARALHPVTDARPRLSLPDLPLSITFDAIKHQPPPTVSPSNID